MAGKKTATKHKKDNSANAQTGSPSKKTKTTKTKATTKKGSKKKPVPAPVPPPAPVPAPAPPPAPVPAAPAPAKTPVKGPVDKKKLSDEAKREFRNLATQKKLTVNDFAIFSVNELKLVLKLNDRPTTGNKTDLSKNLCDYMIKGCPPRCPKCGGGKLRVKMSGKTEQFYCPGYMEDDEFVNCGFKSDSVARVPWKNP